MKYKNILVFLFLTLILTGCTKIEIKDNLNFEINSEIRPSDLAVNKDEITVLDDNLIDTSTLGEKKVVIKYLVNDKDKYKTVLINIVDTKKPLINCDDTLSTTKGKNIDILKSITIIDNSKEEITPTIEGTYDINKVGNYNIKIIASDSSSNKSEKDIVLSVKNETVKTSGYYVHKEKTYWTGIRFKKDNKVQIDYNLCPGAACGLITESGTFKVKDTTVTLNLTTITDESGKRKQKSNVKCSISSELKIVCDKFTYKWNSKFK